MGHLFATKPLDRILAEASETGEHTLKRALGPLNLVTLGIGAIIGAGIFVLTGIVSARYAGPAVILSFVICSVTCVLIGLCYSEFSSLLPIAGSAYTYSYASLGEFVAWIIGWDLILEYSFGAATVAWGWSGYLNSFLANFGITLPPWLAGTHWDEFVLYKEQWISARALPTGINAAGLHHAHGAFNLFGLVIIVLASTILVRGVKESAGFNSTIVLVKVFVLLFFIAVGGHYLAGHRQVISANWHPFSPFGWSGVLRGAAFLFFAFIGFDAVSTAAQEARRPQRDIPFAVLGSLTICTILYVLFASVLMGLVGYSRLDVANPLAIGIEQTGLHWGNFVVTLGALGGLTSTVFVMLLGCSRILFSLSKDGLLPPIYSKIHPRFRTPYQSSLILCVFVGALASLLPVNVLAELVSIGTLLAFAVVCAGLLVLRYRRPDILRPFRTPWVPTVPIIAIVAILVLMRSLSLITWLRLGIWFLIGLAVYFGYGRNHSHVQGGEVIPQTQEPRRSPEKELVSAILSGAFKIFVIIMGIGAVLAAVSVFFPSVDQHFRALAYVLSVAAIIMGLLYSIVPSLKSLLLLRKPEPFSNEERERAVRELIASLEKD